MAPLSSTHTPQVRIPATYMRGGTSKGVFFRLGDLPERCQVPGPARDALFLRVIGSPDPYSAHMDGMGGATSSTSKCVILAKSSQPDHDVDYLYGQIAIDKALIDWSGNCGNLSTAAGAFAIHAGLVDPARIPQDGTCVVRVWQANIGKTIIAHVPITDGAVQRGPARQGLALPEPYHVHRQALCCQVRQHLNQLATGQLLVDQPGRHLGDAQALQHGLYHTFAIANGKPRRHEAPFHFARLGTGHVPRAAQTVGLPVNHTVMGVQVTLIDGRATRLQVGR